MLADDIRKFGERNQVITSRQLVDKYAHIRGVLTDVLIDSPIEYKEQRESAYLQVKALDTVMHQLINGWE